MITGLLVALFLSAVAYGIEVGRHNKTRGKLRDQSLLAVACMRERDTAVQALDNALPTLKAPAWTL